MNPNSEPFISAPPNSNTIVNIVMNPHQNTGNQIKPLPPRQRPRADVQP